MPVTAIRTGGMVFAAIVAGVSLAARPVGVQPASPTSVTYTEHVAPILNANCVVCHRPGAIGPFSLATYGDVRPRVRMIASAVQRREMPPWTPEPGVGRFRGERRLDIDEIDLIQRWVRAGAPEGDPGKLPAPPSWPDGWQRGTPDLVVTMSEPYALPGRGPDVYRNFAVPIPIERDRFVTAVELKSDTTRGLHHARILLDSSGSARRLDAADTQPGYDDRRVDRARPPDGHFLGWAPGTLPNAPDGLAWRLPVGADLVLKAHLVPSGEPHDIQVSVGFFFTDTPAAAAPVVVQLGSQTIDIPAADAAHVVEDSYRVPIDVDVLAVYPHAHFLGRSMFVSARLPDGTPRPLLQIDNWDFNWQDEYRYAEPVRLPEGSTMTMRYVFDNSESNPNNPFRPPRRVRFGPRSTDEMAELMIQVLPVDPADRSRLTRDVERKVGQIVLSGSEKQLADDPGSAALEARVGVNLIAVGRVSDAIEHLEAAVRLDPASSATQYQLGTALALQGAYTDAIVRFRRALELQPDFVEAHNNLGGLLQMTGRPVEAAAEFRQTLRLDPMHGGAHFNLGGILLAAERFAEAEAEFRRALAVRSGTSHGHAGLGQALAGQGKLDEAVDAYLTAIRLDPCDVEPHRFLGEVQTRLGRQVAAQASFERAEALESNGCQDPSTDETPPGS